MCRTSVQRSRTGFTLVELAVVIVIIGVLAAFGVPQFLKSVERSKAAEAFNYLAAMRASQERFLAKNGYYFAGTYVTTPGPTLGSFTETTTTGDQLDIQQSVPKYYDVGDITESHVTDATHGTAGKPTWSCSLTRKESSYGNYTVTFGQDGFVDDPAVSTIVTYTEINPMSK